MDFRSYLVTKLRPTAGFTLVEMMVTAAIVGVLMVAFTGYMFQQAKQNKVAESRQSYTQLKTNVLNSTSQPETLISSETMQFWNLP